MKTKFAAAAVLALALAACSGAPEAEDRAAETGAVVEAGLSITGGRMVMPAVSGNPGVVYFSAENTGPAAVSLAAVDVSGSARSEIHDMSGGEGMMRMERLEAVELPAGETVQFAPGGKHVMVFELDPGLGAGGKTEVTLMLANGDKASFTVPIQGAGDDR